MSKTDLQRAARAAYERNRWQNAALFALPLLLVPLFGCWLGTAPSTAFLVAPALLLVGALALWRGQVMGRALWLGLIAGAVPFALALGARSYGHVCMGGSCTSLCVPACVVGGLTAGLAVAYVARRSKAPLVFAFTGGAAAMLVGCLGCSCVGYAGMMGLASGLAGPLLAVTATYWMRKSPA